MEFWSVDSWGVWHRTLKYTSVCGVCLAFKYQTYTCTTLCLILLLLVSQAYRFPPRKWKIKSWWWIQSNTPEHLYCCINTSVSPFTKQRRIGNGCIPYCSWLLPLFPTGLNAMLDVFYSLTLNISREKKFRTIFSYKLIALTLTSSIFALDFPFASSKWCTNTYREDPLYYYYSVVCSSSFRCLFNFHNVRDRAANEGRAYDRVEANGFARFTWADEWQKKIFERKSGMAFWFWFGIRPYAGIQTLWETRVTDAKNDFVGCWNSLLYLTLCC